MMLSGSLSLLVLLTQVTITPVFAIISNSFASLPKAKYDFVIVGGGNAGAVLANRLSEVPKWNVLVIESGPTHEGVFNSRVPHLVGTLQNTIHDWNYTSTPQVALNGRSVALAQGHILGGSATINGMIYTRGSSSDYDRWARVTGDSGWSWNRMLPYIYKAERWVAPSDGHNPAGQYDPIYHGKGGAVGVSITGNPQALDAKIMEASMELGGEYAYDLDVNDGNPLGINWIQLTVEKGERSGAADNYLAAKYANRRNLHILVDHAATKVAHVGDHQHHGVPSLRKVHFKPRGSNATGLTVTASKEVLLCAGTYGTPHILLHSGVGDAAELSSTGITPTVHLPGVGQNLTEHASIFIGYGLGINGTVEITPEMQMQWLDQWNAKKTGPMVGIGVNHLGWIRIPQSDPIWQRHSDPSSGSNTPHIDRIWSLPAPHLPQSIAASTLIIQPVKLATSDPVDHPLIDLALLSTPFDMYAAVHGIKSVRRFFEAPAWAEWNLQGPYGLPEDDAGIEEYIRSNAIPAAHPVGTASMSPAGAQWGVVDPDLKLKKARGIRVVDASVMPYVPAGHTMAPVYAIAERAADLIKRSWI